MYNLEDLFIHSSGPFGGPFFVWGGGVLQNRENPPPPPGYGLVTQHLFVDPARARARAIIIDVVKCETESSSCTCGLGPVLYQKLHTS